MMHTAVSVLGGYPFGTMQNVGIDNGTGACRECDFTKWCGMDQLPPVNIKDLNGFVPVPGIESLLIFLEIQASTDIREVGMKLWKQFFLCFILECNTIHRNHGITSVALVCLTCVQ